jgi:hypothetical protein
MHYARRRNPGVSGISTLAGIFLATGIIDRNPKGLQAKPPRWKSLIAFRLSYYNQNDSIPLANNISS